MFDALIKVGGSLYHKSSLQANLITWTALAVEYRLLLLPGGGPFADSVRAADARFGLNDSAAHWMAILAMDQYAYLLADLMPKSSLVRDLSTATAVCTSGKLAILAPSALLLQVDPLPHSWQVTSDSIAAWLAKYADIQLLILLKSIEGVYQVDARGKSINLWPQGPNQALADHDIVDPYFTQTLSSTTNCWIIDGTQPDRLAELLQRAFSENGVTHNDITDTCTALAGSARAVRAQAQVSRFAPDAPDA